MRSRRGFSIIELLVVLTIIGILVRMGFPRYQDLRRQADARAIIGDVLAVRVAAYNFNTERQSWPSDAGQGTVPAELVALLPAGFTFSRPTFTMDWDVFPGAASGGGSGSAATATDVIALTIDSPDTVLVSAVRHAATSGIPYLISGTRTTFLLAGFGGNF